MSYLLIFALHIVTEVDISTIQLCIDNLEISVGRIVFFTKSHSASKCLSVVARSL